MHGMVVVQPPTTERPTLRVGPIELDLDSPTVRIHRDDAVSVVDLPITEHRLLAFLLQTPGHARTRADICAGVWPAGQVDVRTVDQYVRRLRRSLQGAGAASIVQTLNRYGYRVQPALLLPNTPAPLGVVTAVSRGVPRVTTVRPKPSNDRS